MTARFITRAEMHYYLPDLFNGRNYSCHVHYCSRFINPSLMSSTIDLGSSIESAQVTILQTKVSRSLKEEAWHEIHFRSGRRNRSKDNILLETLNWYVETYLVSKEWTQSKAAISYVDLVSKYLLLKACSSIHQTKWRCKALIRTRTTDNASPVNMASFLGQARLGHIWSVNTFDRIGLDDGRYSIDKLLSSQTHHSELASLLPI